MDPKRLWKTKLPITSCTADFRGLLQANKELQDEPIWPLFGAQIAQNTKDATGVLRFLTCVSNAALDDPKRLLETKPFLGRQSPLVRPISRVRGVGPLQLTSFA